MFTFFFRWAESLFLIILSHRSEEFLLSETLDALRFHLLVYHGFLEKRIDIAIKQWTLIGLSFSQGSISLIFLLDFFDLFLIIYRPFFVFWVVVCLNEISPSSSRTNRRNKMYVRWCCCYCWCCCTWGSWS